MNIVAITYKNSVKLTREQICELYGDELCFLDGFDDCIVGVVERCSQLPIVCYDKCLILDKLVDDEDMTINDAEEFFEFNQLGLWAGESSPCFITHIQSR
jgi:hypothetical protein